MTKRQDGFTLLEVMVAFIIFAVASVSLMRSVTYNVNNQARLEQITLGQWVAENHYNELLIEGKLPGVGESKKRVTLAERNWEVVQVVKETADPEMRRIELSVLLEEEGAVRKRQIASLITFLGGE